VRGRWIAAWLLAACSRAPEPSSDPAPAPAPDPTPTTPAAARADAAAEVAHRVVPDLAAAVRDVAGGARVVAFGELHARTDRAAARSALARFSDDALPALADRLSDLIVETWVVDPRCGAGAADATRRVEGAMRRPPATRNELGTLLERTRAAGVTPHVMRLTCDDYAGVAPAGGEVDAERLLDLVTRELGRIAESALAHREREPAPRPLIAIYGGAMHNDLHPYDSVAQWSIGPRLDRATGGRYVEIDLYVPEYAEADPLTRTEPWFPLVTAAPPDQVTIIERAPRSYVLILPRGAPAR